MYIYICWTCLDYKTTTVLLFVMHIQDRRPGICAMAVG